MKGEFEPNYFSPIQYTEKFTETFIIDSDERMLKDALQVLFWVATEFIEKLIDWAFRSDSNNYASFLSVMIDVYRIQSSFITEVEGMVNSEKASMLLKCVMNKILLDKGLNDPRTVRAESHID